MRKTILIDNTLSHHLEMYQKDSKSYLDEVRDIFSNVDYCKTIPLSNKGRVVATLLHNTNNCTQFELPEIVLGCQILDSRRALKETLNKLTKIQLSLIDNPNNKRLIRKRKHLNDYKKKVETLYENNPKLSMTLAKIRLIKKWVKTLDENYLTNRALFFDASYRSQWKELADICHFAPKDFQLDWFMSYCFSGNIPETSLLYRIKNGDQQTLANIYQTTYLPYEYIRLHKPNEELKKAIATKENLRTVLWYHDEIGFYHIILSRLNDGCTIDLPYAKLADIIISMPNLTLKQKLINIADEKLKKYKMSFESPVGIFCDASGSMEVAIRTSSIVSSLLCALTNAELSIFRSNNTFVQNPPRTMTDVIQFVHDTRTDGQTAPAASLFPYVNLKKILKTIIVVTDQEENWTCNRQYFSSFYKTYVETVFPAKLIFITFRDVMNNETGQMYKSIEHTLGSVKTKELVTEYNFSKKEPDLRRLDAILEQYTTTIPAIHLVPATRAIETQTD